MNDKKQLVQTGLRMLWQETYRKLSGYDLRMGTIADVQQMLADIDAAMALIEEMASLEEYRRLVERQGKLEETLQAVREALNT